MTRVTASKTVETNGIYLAERLIQGLIVDSNDVRMMR
jgi:hypothetical protein